MRFSMSEPSGSSTSTKTSSMPTNRRIRAISDAPGLLRPCCTRARGPGRPDVARARRSAHGGDRARLPGSRGNDETAAFAGETQDQRCGHPLQRPALAPAAGAAGCGSGGRLPDLQRGLRRPRRSRGGGAPAGRGAHRDARRAGGARPDGADAARRRAPGGPVRGRRAGAACRPGPFALGHREDHARARARFFSAKTRRCSRGRLSDPGGPRKLLAVANPSGLTHFVHRRLVDEKTRDRDVRYVQIAHLFD
jgi:hypothetical protein